MPKLRPEAEPIKMYCGDAETAELTARANKNTGKIQFFCPFLKKDTEICQIWPDNRDCRIIRSFRASGALAKVEQQLLFKIRMKNS